MELIVSMDVGVNSVYDEFMRISRLILENFRNYEHLDLDFSGVQNLVLVGDNAQGKSNLLESVAMICLGKSFRSARVCDAISWNAPHGRVVLEHENSKLEIFIQKKPKLKVMKVNEREAKASEFIGRMRMVLFTPEHLQLIYGGPKIRRQFFDRALIQISGKYVSSMMSYQKILKHRNALLKALKFGRSQAWELDLWDARLLHEASILWKGRKEFAEEIKPQIADFYKNISGTSDQLTLIYDVNEAAMENSLAACRLSDIMTGFTSIGPHRDDFVLKINGRPLADVGSQGEVRSAVLALKMAEIRFMESKTDKKPLLLLDDVFSELDALRQKRLGEFLTDYSSIVSTSSLDHVLGLHHASLYRIKSGEMPQQIKAPFS